MLPKRITFDGFLMDMAEAGVKDSEGVFTVAAARSAKQLKEQFARDTLLAYTELLQGFRELGAAEVRIVPNPPGSVDLLAKFPGQAPDLGALFDDPLNILSARHALHSGTGLLLLQHEDDLVWWSRRGGAQEAQWKFDSTSKTFRRQDRGLRWPSSPVIDGTVWRLSLRCRETLALFPRDRLKCWRDTPLAQEFVDRMAFYGVPTFCADQPLQSPIPGRLVPVDFYQKHETGPMGYNWEPLAFELVAGPPDSSMSFLSEPFTGTVASVVSVDGRVQTGFGSWVYPNYVSFKGHELPRTATQIPFRRKRFFGSGSLATPGFASFPSSLINPRMDGGLTRVHCWGQPLFCSRLTMLSTALGGPSTVVFLKHGAVLGGRHEDLGVPGSLCLVGTEGLSTDLSRRTVRRDDSYLRTLASLRRGCLAFAAETAENLPREHWARKPLLAALAGK
jgi:hypothetical protein